MVMQKGWCREGGAAKGLSPPKGPQLRPWHWRKVPTSRLNGSVWQRLQSSAREYTMWWMLSEMLGASYAQR